MAEFDGKENKGGAPAGNRNALNAHKAKRALIKALAHRANGDSDEAMMKIWTAVIQKAEQGSEPHAKLIFERIDGKPVQAIQHSGADGGEIVFKSRALDIDALRAMPIEELRKFREMLRNASRPAAEQPSNA